MASQKVLDRIITLVLSSKFASVLVDQGLVGKLIRMPSVGILQLFDRMYQALLFIMSMV